MTRATLSALGIVIWLLLALACGVTVSGRIDVGADAGTPAHETPCPQGKEP
jgi:hypothetical protein